MQLWLAFCGHPVKAFQEQVELGCIGPDDIRNRGQHDVRGVRASFLVFWAWVNDALEERVPDGHFPSEAIIVQVVQIVAARDDVHVRVCLVSGKRLAKCEVVDESVGDDRLGHRVQIP